MPKGTPNRNPMAVNIRFCVYNNLLNALLLNPRTLSVAISLSISVNDINPKLYKTIIAKTQAKNDNMYMNNHMFWLIPSQSFSISSCVLVVLMILYVYLHDLRL